MKKVILLTIFLLSFPFIFNNSVFAHPGRTAADGCHYCRTNCDSWGVAWNERHCHGGGTVQGVQESAPIYNPPTSTPIPWPTWTPIPTYTPIPTNRPTPILTNTPTPTNTPSPTITLKPTKIVSVSKKAKVNKISKTKKQTIKKKTFWQWLFNL